MLQVSHVFHSFLPCQWDEVIKAAPLNCNEQAQKKSLYFDPLNFPRKQKTLKSPKNSANLYYIHKVPEMLTKMHLGARDDTSNAV